jgi:hypothetical protein
VVLESDAADKPRVEKREEGHTGQAGLFGEQCAESCCQRRHHGEHLAGGRAPHAGGVGQEGQHEEHRGE